MQPFPPKSVDSTGREEIWLEDHELIRGIKNGEESALSAMMARYWQQVFSTAFHVLRLESDAQEVAQDVFWAVWRSPDRFDMTRGALLSWLLILSRSRALDLLRRIRSNLAHLHEIGPVKVGVPPDQSVARERGVLIEELLQRLSGEQRWIIRKVYFEGFTYAEVAALRSTPVGTMKNRARRALKMLRIGLDEVDFSLTRSDLLTATESPHVQAFTGVRSISEQDKCPDAEDCLRIAPLSRHYYD
jgi:RNA polymerase sigma-70 factor (ECF subfamily)